MIVLRLLPRGGESAHVALVTYCCSRMFALTFALLIGIDFTAAVPFSPRAGHGDSLCLFSETVRQTCPVAVLDYVESAYRSYVRGADDRGRFDCMTFVYGSWDSLASLTDTTACSISLLYGRLYSIEWEGVAQVEFPIQYDRILGAGRAGIEDSLIARLQRRHAVPVCVLPVSCASDTLDGGGCYIVGGDKYGRENVSRDIYLVMKDDHTLSTVYSAGHPVETIADLFICGTDVQSVPIVLDISKHDYGARDTILTTVESLREVLADDGCVPFYGTESADDDRLCATVFFYNQALGYDHVLRVECDPRLIGAEDFELIGRMSLFVPTNNVKDLYEMPDPDAHRKRIKYE